MTPPVHRDNYRMQGFFRFVLALMVLWSHSVPAFFPELTSLFSRLQLGNVAVSAFFVLSGYLMSEAIAIWYSGRLSQFISNRYLRISPPLFVAAVVSIGVHIALSQMNLTMIGIEEIPNDALSRSNIIISLLDPLFPFNIPVAKLLGVVPPPNSYAFVRYAWAIFTELIFYWTLAAYFVTARLADARIASVTFFLIVVLMFVLGTGHYNDLFDPAAARPIARIPFVFHMQWAPHFLIGVMISRYARDRNPAALTVLLAAGLMAAIQLALYVRLDVIGTIPVLGLYFATLAAGFWLILANKREYRLGPFRFTAKLDRAFGNLSYPIYINQFALALAILSILYLVIGAGVGTLPVVIRLALFLVFNLLIIGTAAALISLTDSLTDQLRDRLRGAALSTD